MDPLYQLFTHQAQSSPGSEWWVSKSDVADYHRCPWAFWIMDSGQLSREAVFEEVPVLQTFIDQGMRFEADVRSQAVAIPDGAVPNLAQHGTSVIYGAPLLHNDALGIYGRPDAIAAESGALAPVEVKSHRKRTAMDEIELCFYWELMAPWRTWDATLTVQSEMDGPRSLAVKSPPHGYLILPDPKGGFRRERIWLTDKRFEQMRRLVADVRESRKEPPSQRICACVVCTRVFRQQIETAAHTRGDLTLISGIGRTRATVLETAGIPSIEDLITAEAVQIVTVFRAAKVGIPSQDEVEGWIHHARALHRDEAVIYGDSLFDSKEYIALDLEYDSDPACRAIYLAGATTVTVDGQDYTSIWADYEGERALLERLAKVLEAHPELPIVTWNGKSADGVQLRKACAGMGMEGLWSTFQERHLDLYVNLKSSVRFPIAGFDLKSLANYLGLTPTSKVVDGLDTVRLWRQYCKAPGSKRAIAIRQDLTRYNQQDVEILVRLTDRVRHLANGRKVA